MHLEDYVCNHLKHIKTIQKDCCDVEVFKCKKTNRTFDQFHAQCCEDCEHDTTRVYWDF